VSGTKLGAYRIESFHLAGVGFQYPSGGTVLENVTLELPMNAIVHVKGPTGQGQSTFLKILALLAEPTSGVVHVNGMAATEMTFEEFLPWRLEIGYTFEMGGLLANRTLEDNLALPHLYHNLSDPEAIRAEIRAIAKRFRFENLLDQRPASVSGGLRKLVTILRPVLLRPSFLVMDAPLAGLDLETSRELELLIFEMHEKSEIETIYYSSRGQQWPTLIEAESLWVENGKIDFAHGRKAAG
jgi:ABC-type lipoprotein export system ATPase subunit